MEFRIGDRIQSLYNNNIGVIADIGEKTIRYKITKPGKVWFKIGDIRTIEFGMFKVLERKTHPLTAIFKQ